MRLSQFKAIFTNALADYLALDIDPALRALADSLKKEIFCASSPELVVVAMMKSLPALQAFRGVKKFGRFEDHLSAALNASTLASVQSLESYDPNDLEMPGRYRIQLLGRLKVYFSVARDTASPSHTEERKNLVKGFDADLIEVFFNHLKHEGKYYQFASEEQQKVAVALLTASSAYGFWVAIDALIDSHSTVMASLSLFNGANKLKIINALNACKEKIVDVAINKAIEQSLSRLGRASPVNVKSSSPVRDARVSDPPLITPLKKSPDSDHGSPVEVIYDFDFLISPISPSEVNLFDQYRTLYSSEALSDALAPIALEKIAGLEDDESLASDSLIHYPLPAGFEALVAAFNTHTKKVVVSNLLSQVSSVFLTMTLLQAQVSASSVDEALMDKLLLLAEIVVQIKKQLRSYESTGLLSKDAAITDLITHIDGYFKQAYQDVLTSTVTKYVQLAVHAKDGDAFNELTKLPEKTIRGHDKKLIKINHEVISADLMKQLFHLFMREVLGDGQFDFPDDHNSHVVKYISENINEADKAHCQACFKDAIMAIFTEPDAEKRKTYLTKTFSLLDKALLKENSAAHVYSGVFEEFFIGISSGTEFSSDRKPIIDRQKSSLGFHFIDDAFVAELKLKVESHNTDAAIQENPVQRLGDEPVRNLSAEFDDVAKKTVLETLTAKLNSFKQSIEIFQQELKDENWFYSTFHTKSDRKETVSELILKLNDILKGLTGNDFKGNLKKLDELFSYLEIKQTEIKPTSKSRLLACFKGRDKDGVSYSGVAACQAAAAVWHLENFDLAAGQDKTFLTKSLLADVVVDHAYGLIQFKPESKVFESGTDPAMAVRAAAIFADYAGKVPPESAVTLHQVKLNKALRDFKAELSAYQRDFAKDRPLLNASAVRIERKKVTNELLMQLTDLIDEFNCVVADVHKQIQDLNLRLKNFFDLIKRAKVNIENEMLPGRSRLYKLLSKLYAGKEEIIFERHASDRNFSQLSQEKTRDDLMFDGVDINGRAAEVNKQFSNKIRTLSFYSVSESAEALFFDCIFSRLEKLIEKVQPNVAIEALYDQVFAEDSSSDAKYDEVKNIERLFKALSFPYKFTDLNNLALFHGLMSSFAKKNPNNSEAKELLGSIVAILKESIIESLKKAFSGVGLSQSVRFELYKNAILLLQGLLKLNATDREILLNDNFYDSIFTLFSEENHERASLMSEDVILAKSMLRYFDDLARFNPSFNLVALEEMSELDVEDTHSGRGSEDFRIEDGSTMERLSPLQQAKICLSKECCAIENSKEVKPGLEQLLMQLITCAHAAKQPKIKFYADVKRSIVNKSKDHDSDLFAIQELTDYVKKVAEPEYVISVQHLDCIYKGEYKRIAFRDCGDLKYDIEGIVRQNLSRQDKDFLIHQAIYRHRSDILKFLPADLVEVFLPERLSSDIKGDVECVLSLEPGAAQLRWLRQLTNLTADDILVLTPDERNAWLKAIKLVDFDAPAELKKILESLSAAVLDPSKSHLINESIRDYNNQCLINYFEQARDKLYSYHGFKDLRVDTRIDSITDPKIKIKWVQFKALEEALKGACQKLASNTDIQWEGFKCDLLRIEAQLNLDLKGKEQPNKGFVTLFRAALVLINCGVQKFSTEGAFVEPAPITVRDSILGYVASPAKSRDTAVGSQSKSPSSDASDLLLKQRPSLAVASGKF